jgi:hypothetical protein
VDNHAHFGERERLQNVIAGAGLHCFHGCLDGTVCRHYHDRQICILPLDRLQKFQPAHAWELEIG